MGHWLWWMVWVIWSEVTAGEYSSFLIPGADGWVIGSASHESPSSRWPGASVIFLTALKPGCPHLRVRKQCFLHFLFWVVKGLRCCSVAHSCPTLCDPVGRSTPGLPVFDNLLEFAQTHVHWICDAIPHLILCHPLLLLPSVFPSTTVWRHQFFGAQLFLLSGSHIPYMTTGKTLAFKGPCSQTKPLPTKVYRMLSMEALFSVASAFSFPFVIC